MLSACSRALLHIHARFYFDTMALSWYGRTILYAGTGVALLLAPATHAQTLADLPPGSRVSIGLGDGSLQRRTPGTGHSVIGQLVRVTQDSLYLEIRGAAPFGVARQAIGGMWVSGSVSRKRSAIQQGAFAALVGAGLVFSSRDFNNRSGTKVVGVTALTAGIGVFVGARWPSETWRRLRN